MALSSPLRRWSPHRLRMSVLKVFRFIVRPTLFQHFITNIKNGLLEHHILVTSWIKWGFSQNPEPVFTFSGLCNTNCACTGCGCIKIKAYSNAFKYWVYYIRGSQSPNPRPKQLISNGIKICGRWGKHWKRNVKSCKLYWEISCLNNQNTCTSKHLVIYKLSLAFTGFAPLLMGEAWSSKTRSA